MLIVPQTVKKGIINTDKNNYTPIPDLQASFRFLILLVFYICFHIGLAIHAEYIYRIFSILAYFAFGRYQGFYFFSGVGFWFLA
jgi:hypothetical protein